MTSERPKACVILGAGASHAVHNGVPPIIDGDFKPPLAKDLLSVSNPKHWQLIEAYPGAQLIANALYAASQRDTFDLEKELKRLATHEDTSTQMAFAQVPPFIRDRIVASSKRFVPQPGTQTELMHYLVAENPHDILVIDLNYDDFLERSLYQLAPKLSITSMDDYIRDGRQVKVVKLHGSIHWFKLLGRANRAWVANDLDISVLERTPAGEIHFFINYTDTPNIQIEGRHVYPVLTTPLAGKNAGTIVCPTRHLDEAKQFLSECQKFLVIGCSGKDEDLKELLQTSIKNVAALHLVDTNTGTQEVEEQFRTIPRFRGLAFSSKRNSPYMTYNQGFVPYVQSGVVEDFATI